MLAAPPVKFVQSRLTVWLLGCYAGLALLSLPLRLRFLPGSAKADLDAEIVLVFVLGLCQLLAIQGFVSWFKASYARLRLVGVFTRYTPAMAVAVFFIPFSVFYEPARVLNSIYEGFDPARFRAGLKVQKTIGSGASWWYAFLASSFLSDIASGYLIRHGQTNTGSLLFVLIGASQLLSGIAAAGAARYVHAVLERQKSCAALLRADGKMALSISLEDESHERIAPRTRTLRALFVVSGLLCVACVCLLFFSKSEVVVPWLRLTIGSYFIVALFSIVSFLSWLYVAVQNIRSVSPFKEPAGLAVLGFVIPFVNLVYPWFTMKRIWCWLERINGGIWHDAYGPVVVREDRDVRAPLVNFWWTAVWVEVLSAGGFRLWKLVAYPEVPPPALVVCVLAAESLVTTGLLYAIVSGIGWKVASLERFLSDRQAEEIAATPIAVVVHDNGSANAGGTAIDQSPDGHFPPAGWSDVLFPFASTINDGIINDTIEDRRKRDAEVSLHEAEEEMRKEFTFNSAMTRTELLRLLLLLGVFAGAAEAWMFPGIAVRAGSATQLFIVVMAGVVPCGLPAWVALGQWAKAETRNGVALGILIPGSGNEGLRALTLREPSMLHALGIASGLDLRAGSQWVIWNFTLRMVQTAPLWLALGGMQGGSIAIVMALVFLLALVVCLWITADMVRQIDSGFEDIRASRPAHHGAASIAAQLGVRRPPPSLG
jgi:hypothetical protein